MNETIKKQILIGVAAIAVLLALLLIVSKIKSMGENKIGFPRKLMRDYNISLVKDAVLPRSGEKLLIFGYEAKDLIKINVSPMSFLAIYKTNKKGADLVYRFSPKLPEKLRYPRPLRLERVEVIDPTVSMTPEAKSDELVFVTSWGETGADYFGTHPIVITYKEGKFKAINFYEGYVSKNAKLKDLSWTEEDFEVANYFDRTDISKTILTQGVDITKDLELELSFYGDNKPHAAAHEIVKLKFPLILGQPSK